MTMKKPRAKPVPPTHTQFRKGKSGNPRGRPKGSRNLAGLLKEALNAKVGDDALPVTKLEAAVRNIADSAAAGDPRTLQMLLAELRRLEPRQLEPEHDCMAVVRKEMEGAKERFWGKLRKLSTDPGGRDDLS